MNRITISVLSTVGGINALAVAVRALGVGVLRWLAAASGVVGVALRVLVLGVARRTAWDWRVLYAALGTLAVGVGLWFVATVRRRR